MMTTQLDLEWALVLIKESKPYDESITPPKINSAGWFCSVIILLAPKYATVKKTKSEKTTPKSMKKAFFKPLEILVSKSIKNNGPNEKDKMNPKGKAAK